VRFDLATALQSIVQPNSANIEGKMSSSCIPKSLSRTSKQMEKRRIQRKTIYQSFKKKLFIKKSSPMSTNLTDWCQETRKSPKSRKQKHNGIQENTEFRE